MKPWIALFVSLSFLSCRQQERPVVILYENDVHCAVDGYAAFAGLRDAIRLADTAEVFAVSAGDFLQGGAMGSVSNGAYPVDLMCKVGYDALVPGNHEFDFGMERMHQQLSRLGSGVVCANLTVEGGPLYPSLVIRPYGRTKIAFVGVTTPQAMFSEAYAFTDSLGRPCYSLCPDDLYARVQDAVDSARRVGCRYVVVLSHLGEVPEKDVSATSLSLIAATRGIDAVLDGHSHHLIPCREVLNADGDAVVLSQTGCQFSHVGKLVIKGPGRLSASCVPIDSIPCRSAAVKAVLDSLNRVTADSLGKRIGRTDFPLRIDDENGVRLVRSQETNQGDFFADAFRFCAGSQLALINGGSLRSGLPAGELCVRQIVDAMPFGNKLCTVRLSGKQLRSLLEFGASRYPEESGKFLQVSGLRYTLCLPEEGGSKLSEIFVETSPGCWTPLQEGRRYTLCTLDYLLEGGDGNHSLDKVELLRSKWMDTTQAIERFMEHCGGVVPERYRGPQGRITTK